MSTVNAEHVFLGPRNQRIYLLDDAGNIDVLSIKSLQRITRLYQDLGFGDANITAVAPLLGRYSLITGDDRGRIVQGAPWLMPMKPDSLPFAP